MTSHSPALDTALSILQQTFGYHQFRGAQAEIITHVCTGQDALVLMPTGGGKSLCYQIPALVRDGIGIVISPLIALMEDQVQALRANGVRAAYLNSTLDWQEVQQIESAMRQNQLDLVYVAPERLCTERFLSLLEECQISLFALDEAHCVSQWGHDFRPDYRHVTLLQERWPNIPRIALTATADRETRSDILQQLSLEQAKVFVSSFDRPNITYSVDIKKNPRPQLLSFIRKNHAEDAGIIYCQSRKKVEETAAWLCKEGFNALAYHAKLPPELRKKNQDRFIKEEGIIMVATIAFGMGIDKPNVRFVAHLDLPKSMEAYYQETGRAGRDGLKANVWMAYGMQDVALHRHMIQESPSPEAQKRIDQSRLNALLGYCETTKCRRQALLAYFGEVLPEPCQNCDTCLEKVEAYDGTIHAQKALSAIYRTGQRFGAGHLIDVLTGNKTDRLQQYGHHLLPTFGVGKDLDKKQWQSVFRQLLAQGLFHVNHDLHGAFELSPASRDILKGQKDVTLRKDPVRKGLNGLRGKRTSPTELAALTDQDKTLLDDLRTLRLHLAQDQNVPPYVIFHDRTLLEMVQERPKTDAELLEITGVGRSKLEKYGADFLACLTDQSLEQAS